MACRLCTSRPSFMCGYLTVKSICEELISWSMKLWICYQVHIQSLIIDMQLGFSHHMPGPGISKNISDLAGRCVSQQWPCLYQSHTGFWGHRGLNLHSSCHRASSNLKVKVFQILLFVDAYLHIVCMKQSPCTFFLDTLTCCFDRSISIWLQDLRCFILHSNIDHAVIEHYIWSRGVSTEIPSGCIYICCGVILHVYALAVDLD